MSLLKKLQSRFGRYAIQGMIRYVVACMVLVYIISMVIDPNYIHSLSLDPAKIMQGEVWRLFTFLFIPPLCNPLFLFFGLYLLYTYGVGMEMEWGAFRLNCYYFLGALMLIIAAFAGGDGLKATLILNKTLFLAFAVIYPDFTLLLFFVLPVKVKYFAYIIWFYFIFTIISGPYEARIMVGAGVINYLLFFGPAIISKMKTRRQSTVARRRLQSTRDAGEPFHKCVICGKTDDDSPDLDFRVCPDCTDGQEYCDAHLDDHEHQ